LKFKKKDIYEKNSLKEYCSWEEIRLLTQIVASKIKRSNKKYDVILGITNGGIIPARLMALELDVDHIQFLPVRNKRLHIEEMPQLATDKNYLVVDEIYDTGQTFSTVKCVMQDFDCDYAFLMRRLNDIHSNEIGNETAFIGKILNHGKWIVFPWEQRVLSEDNNCF
jgi:hypoxanthine phosphoribosyltransferase